MDMKEAATYSLATVETSVDSIQELDEAWNIRGASSTLGI
jgi:hypothetical protein